MSESMRLMLESAKQLQQSKLTAAKARYFDAHQKIRDSALRWGNLLIAAGVPQESVKYSWSIRRADAPETEQSYQHDLNFLSAVVRLTLSNGGYIHFYATKDGGLKYVVSDKAMYTAQHNGFSSDVWMRVTSGMTDEQVAVLVVWIWEECEAAAGSSQRPHVNLPEKAALLKEVASNA